MSYVNILQTGDGAYLATTEVPSESNSKTTYVVKGSTVDGVDYSWSCDCPSYIFSSTSPKSCKHISKYASFIANEIDAYAKTKTVKYTVKLRDKQGRGGDSVVDHSQVDLIHYLIENLQPNHTLTITRS